MGKKDKKKGAGAAKTAAKTEKKAANKLKKELAAKGEEEVESLLAKRTAEAVEAGLVEEEVAMPSRRSAFSLTPHPDKDQLILFGGEFFNGSKTTVFNDLYFYNIKHNRWTRLTTSQAPPPRSGHQAVAVSQGGGQLWVYGGEFTSPTQSQFHHFKDLWVFHLADKRWQKITAAGGPSPRSGHRMVCARKQLLVFGGFRDNGRAYTYFNDVHVFSLQDYTWTQVKPSGTAPCPRSGCQMGALTEGVVVVSGGYSRRPLKKDVDQGITHTDMFTLTFEKEGWRWQSVKQGGMIPSARSGLALSQPPLGEKVYLFGGVFDQNEDEEELEGQFYNDLYQLDLKKRIWHTVSLAGKKDGGGEKKKRRRKKEGEDGEEEVEEQMERMTVDAECSGEENRAGGAELVNSDGIFTVTVGPAPQTTASVDKKVSEEAFVPSPRMNAGLAVKKGILYLYGGMYEVDDRQLTLGDFYCLDLGKLDEWKTLIPPEDESEMEWIESDDEDSEEESDDEDSEEESDDDDEDEDMDTD
ncbi:hypothetical protein Pcinc_028256 [Petrolisthes cinctipes]|uniref:Kelch domain-containing protein 4 n=1 Tax=Petrolisthes cinctipes TaxID=88211 RepID=A0AAE1F3B0_PETCI|nr:hypothetical protein Pcinc_028256 [Petrolisthes cinctipes]